jgi:hypothetical protein
LAWRSLSEWQLASASAYLLPPQQRYRPDPNHRRCLEGRRLRIESNQCEQRSYSTYPG